jgi:hypothetical protein
LDFPETLTPFQVVSMLSYSQKFKITTKRCLYFGMVYLLANAGSALLQPGKPTQAAMKCFCPESDVVTMIRLILPVLINRSDSSIITRLGLNPIVIHEIRMSIDELAHSLEYSNDVFESLVELDHLCLVDSLATHLMESSGARIYHYSHHHEGKPVYEQFRLEYRPAQRNSSIPSQCVAFSAQSFSIIHRCPGHGLAIACQEIPRPFMNQLTPFFFRLLQLYFSVNDEFSVTDCGHSVFLNYPSCCEKNISTAIKSIMKIIPYTPRSIITRQSGMPIWIEIVSRDDIRLYSKIDSPVFERLCRTSIDAIAEMTDELGKANPQIRIVWEYGTNRPINIGLICERKRQPKDGRVDNFVRLGTRRYRQTFLIPRQLCHPSMLEILSTRKIVVDWILKILEKDIPFDARGRLYDISETEHNRLLDSAESLAIPYQAVPLSPFYTRETLKTLERLKVKVDVGHKVIIVRKDVESEIMQNVSTKECFHRDRLQVAAFNGRSIVEICRSCVMESLKSMVSVYFEEGEYDMNVLSRMQSKFPFIDGISSEVSIGSLFFSLWMDNEEMSQFVEAWLKGIYHQAINTSPGVVALCFAPVYDDLYQKDFGRRERHPPNQPWVIGGPQNNARHRF